MRDSRVRPVVHQMLLQTTVAKDMSSYNLEMLTPVKRVSEYPLPAAWQTHKIITASSAGGNATATVTLNVLRYLKGSELGK